MTKILLALTFAFVAAQAENIVHYDTKTVKKPAISKPNHPGTKLYTKQYSARLSLSDSLEILCFESTLLKFWLETF